MPASSSEKTHRSRITAACVVCRAKRQKCSGSKPTCDQCRLYNKQCWWSDQKKRGPAKDSLRSLQDRLQETEHLLLALLGYISDDSLRDILKPGAASSGAASSHYTWTHSLYGQAYWSRLPLNSVDSIRQWQKERCSQQFEPDHGEQTSFAEPPVDSPDPGNPRGSLSPWNFVAISPSEHCPPLRVLPDAQRNQPQHTSEVLAGIEPQRTRHHSNKRKASPSRRYSNETHEVANTLFSISHSGNTLKQKPDTELHDLHQHIDKTPQTSKTAEDALSKFPSHLFW